jgi:S-adenosylmethionine-diacylgycerolhomoserine-N-methlytransferase
VSTAQAEHRSFLDRYYGATHRIYDLTRKYWLFGRDTAIDKLLEQPWTSLVEVGSGTGRNLAILRSRRPSAKFGGLDASEVMLAHARSRLPDLSLRYGFAEDADLTAILGARPDRVLFSYCLSMVKDPDQALRNARAHLSPAGEVWVVDFGDLGGMPGPVARGLRKFLDRFHVEPLPAGLLEAHTRDIEHGPGHYFRIARIPPYET